VDAFDADVLIYAAIPGHPLGSRVATLFPVKAPGKSPRRHGVGSALLLPEVMSKPLRDGDATAVRALGRLLTKLDLRPVDRAIAELATVLAARYGLRATDATHLATAVNLGAERFITNNRRDFPESIKEIDVTYPETLPDD
jgi:predicted nucleic acid-binding protein